MKAPFPLVFFGTGDISLSCLHQLLKHSSLEVCGVVTQTPKKYGRGLRLQDTPVALKARLLKIPVWTPSDLRAKGFLSDIKALKASYAVVFSYGKILPPEVLSLYPQRALNFHTSLLPRWRGAAPVERAIQAGDKVLGMSLQVMGEGLDTGPLLAQKKFSFTEDMDARDAFDKMKSLIPDLLLDMVAYMKNEIKPHPQKGEVSYAAKTDKKESLINWKSPSESVFNQIRSLVCGPQAYTFYKGRRLKIYEAGLVKLKEQTRRREGINPPPPVKTQNLKAQNKWLTQECLKAGQVGEIGKEGFVVMCGTGALKIKKVQPESGKVMETELFLRGHPLKPGDFLGF